MFSLGVAFIAAGYAAIFTGVANLRNGGAGPTFLQSLGFRSGAVAPPGSESGGKPLTRADDGKPLTRAA